MKKLALILTFLFCLPVTAGYAAGKGDLYSCSLAGTSATYTRAEIDTVISAGGKCSPLGKLQTSTCTIGNVARRYSNAEVETVLLEEPDAICVRDGVLIVKIANKVVTKKRGLSTTMWIYFGHDSSFLDGQDDDVIRRFARQHAGTGAWMTIMAYTDRSGGQAYNHTLSVKRAGRVKARLQYYGVSPAEIISVSAMGENAPPDPTWDGRRKASNRVVIVRAYK